MMRTLDADFQRKVDEFNQSIGGPSQIAVAWNPRINRWEVWAVPVADSFHPLAKNDHTRKLLRPFPDDSGRWGIRLFVWCRRDTQGRDIGPCEPDDRIFSLLRFVDRFDKDAFRRSVEAPEAQRELAERQALRDTVGAAVEYYWHLDRALVPVNPAIPTTGDWRATKWWR
jgi:hypothetical protein